MTGRDSTASSLLQTGDAMRYALAVLAMMTVSASAQQPPGAQPCGPTKAMEGHIRDRYGESPVGAGITPAGTLFITTNPDTGTFTILMRRPDGMTCLLMGGTGYATLEALTNGSDL